MRHRRRLETWAKSHSRIAITIATVLGVLLSLVTLNILGNGSAEFPDSVPVIGGERLSWPWESQQDCALDPAVAQGLIGDHSSAEGPSRDYLHTCGRRVLDAAGRQVMITGLNWFGMETGTYAPHGLWSRNWQTVLDQVASLGYNTIRLPFSNALFGPGAPPSGINYLINPDLQGLSGLELMDKLVEGASERGLKVVLDRHRPTEAGQSSLWYTDDVSEQRWIDDWVKLAERYRDNDAVIGFDLHNEPKDEATWGSGDLRTDWRLAAERAGNAILAVNPYVLIFVQGVANSGDDYYWWGGYLRGVGNNPVRLNIPNRVVYSPHDYGPEVYEQGWFRDPSFPRNLPAVWDAHWGFIARQNLAPVVVGEFGGRSVGNDREGIWQRSLLEYMRRNHVGFFNWSLNPNSADTGGLLGDDWLSVVQDKQDVYRAYLAGPIDGGRLGKQDNASTQAKLLYRAMNVDPRTANIAFSIQIVNEGAQPLELRGLEVRYWLQAGTLRGRQQLVEIDYAAVGEDHVRGEIVTIQRDGQDTFLRLTFDDGTPTIAPYQTSGEIMVRIHKSDWSVYVQADAYSFASQEDWIETQRVALYRGGKLVWGKEPA